MPRMGRPEVYASQIEPHLDKIPEWYKTMSVRQIAAKLGVSKTTMYKYANEYPALAKALSGGKAGLVDNLHSALKKRAFGYEWKEVQVTETTDETGFVVSRTKKETTRHVPPDLGSIHLLLKNLDPEWRNDDATTLRLKERELEIKEKRAEADAW